MFSAFIVVVVLISSDVVFGSLSAGSSPAQKRVTIKSPRTKDNRPRSSSCCLPWCTPKGGQGERRRARSREFLNAKQESVHVEDRDFTSATDMEGAPQSSPVLAKDKAVNVDEKENRESDADE